MKRGALLISVSLILLLSISLVSAGAWSNFWNKVYGKPQPQLSPPEISLTNQQFGTWSNTIIWIDVMKADVNGDGLDDVIGRDKATGDWWAAISDGTKFTNKFFGSWNASYARTNMIVADVNTDGKDDVIGKIPDGSWWAGISDGNKFINTYIASWTYTAREPMKGDINGDGYIDKVQLDSDGELWVMYSDSTGTLQPAVKIGVWSTAITWLDVQVADVNGDSLADVIGREAVNGNWWAGISTMQAEPTCTDSDGGVNYYVKGEVTASNDMKFNDRCEPDGLLKEYYCQASGIEGFERYSCPNGCSDGACIGENQTCTEGQHGFALSIQGTYGIELNAAIKNGNAKIDVLYGDTTFFKSVGGDLAENLLRTSNTNKITFDQDTDDYFIASWASSTEGESYLLKVTSVTEDTSVHENYTTIQNIITGNTYSNKKTGDVVTISNIELTIGKIDKSNKNVELTINTGGSFNKIYDTYGNSIKLPLQSELPKGNYIFNVFDISGNLVGKYEAYHVNGQAAVDNRCQTAITCTDSDGGENYYKKGEVHVDNEINEDKCFSDNQLHEYWCQAGEQEMTAYECPKGCQDGACTCDKRDKISLNEKKTYTIGDKEYDVTLTYVDSNLAQFYIFLANEDSYETTSKLAEGISERLRDGADFAVTDITYQSFSGGEMSAEICLNTLEEQTCQNLVEKIKNPSDFTYEDVEWRLNWNETYKADWWQINGKQETATEYHASWYSYYNGKNNYLSYSITVFDNQDINLDSYLEERTRYAACVLDNYWTNKENKVYVCNWDILSQQQNPENYQYKTRDIFWVNENALVSVYTYTGSHLSNTEVIKLSQKRVNDFLDDLKNNEYEYVNWEHFNLDYPVSSQLSLSLSQCPSQIKLGTCSPDWQCKTEPIICPPHGEQIRICKDSNCDKQDIKQTLECTPGMCAGCMVPKWFGDEWGNNKCIPYGFRFAQQTGWEYKLVEITGEEQESLTESRAAQLDEVDLDVISNELAYLDWVYINETYTLTPGAEIDVNISQIAEDDLESLTIVVDKIVYIENGDSYVELTFKIKGWDPRQTPVTLNAYCDIDGKIKEQTADWLSCQNSYECTSNLCSAQECTGINQMIKNTSRFKSIAVRVLCRLAHLFNEENYNQCIANFLGAPTPTL